MSALSHLRAAAAAYGATHLNDDGTDAIYRVRPPLPSGAPSETYLVRITGRRGSVVAKERESVRLPAFCPERHISYGGAFCLYWTEVEPHVIDSVDAADQWWGKLTVFLLRQPVAQRQRRWPGKSDARAHGPEAAAFQAKAEGAAGRLGVRFEDALRHDRLKAERRRLHGEVRIRLSLDGTRIKTILEKPRRAMTLRSRCPCSGHTGLPLKSCGNHAAAIVDLTLALVGWQRAEQAFFDEARAAGLACCGTIDGCPLSTAQDREAA